GSGGRAGRSRRTRRRARGGSRAGAAPASGVRPRSRSASRGRERAPPRPPASPVRRPSAAWPAMLPAARLRVMRLTGQVAWITGTSSGIGRAIAERFAGEGAAVLCSDVREDPDPRGFDEGPPTPELIAAAGGRAAYVPRDVTVPAQLEAALATCVEQFGSCDIHVANAGIAPAVRDVLEAEYADYERVIEINQNAVWRACRAVAAQMVAQGGGGRI